MLYLIGLGHRARQGKDMVADIIKQSKKTKNVEVYHFADPLKKEVMNVSRNHPLIYREQKSWSNAYWYSIYSQDGVYTTVLEYEVQLLHEIFENRKIDVYWGMEGNGYDEKKDGLMLQFWGTQWRRQKFADDYWVRKVEDYFRENFYNKDFDGNAYFLLPDTRFPNEVEWIRSMRNEGLTALYVKVVRYNDDDTQYFEPERDKNHESEMSLEEEEPDYLIAAKSGKIESLVKQTDILIDILEQGHYYYEEIA